MLQILKLGGSVITDKDRYATPRRKVIKRLVKEIINAKENGKFKLILVNGAGSFGHMPVRRYGLEYGIKDEKTKFGMAMVHKLVEDLNRIIWEEFLKSNVSSVPIHPMSCVVQNNGNIISFETEHIKNLLKMDVIPLLYGDMVVDLSRGTSIISGDDIVPHLARKLGAGRILMGTDTDGIFDKDPKLFKGASLIKEINNRNYKTIPGMVSGSTSVDVTGGMKEKLNKLIKDVKGIESVVYNASKKGTTEKALLGENVGTLIRIK
ncbi:MAG: isopentenyl phosphate kinase family protein [Candidatus Aenigmarchaeota archaeon]|nr:isopentenyl phosphate kinase family protein [Candidatus Aenigmarchaeota archaeon]